MRSFQLTCLPFARFRSPIAPNQADLRDEAVPQEVALGVANLEFHPFSLDLHLHVERLDRYVHRNLLGFGEPFAGLTERLWNMADIVKLIDAAEALVQAA